MLRRVRNRGGCESCGGGELPGVITTSIEKSKAGHVYYNVTVSNPNTSSDIRATFSYVQSEPIVKRPEDYHLSIIRFSVPGALLPIFIYPNNLPASATPNNTVYSVTLTYLGNSYRTFIQFITQSPLFPQNNISYYDIHNYNHFLAMINIALQTSFTNLKTANPGAPPTQAPFFILDPTSGLISLICQTQYSLPNSIGVFVNYALSLLIVNDALDASYFSINDPNGKDAEIFTNNLLYNGFSTTPVNLLINTTSGSPTITSAGLFTINQDGNTVSAVGVPLNSTASFVDANTMTLSQNATATSLAPVNAIFTNNNLLRIQQNFSTLFNWNSLKSIVLTSGLIPSRSEFVTANDTTSNQISNNTLRILTDFEPLIVTGPDLFNTIQYFPPGEYRLIDLTGQTSLTNIDASFFWQDKQQNLYPIFIPPGQCATIKFLFRLKTLKEGLGEDY